MKNKNKGVYQDQTGWRSRRKSRVFVSRAVAWEYLKTTKRQRAQQTRKEEKYKYRYMDDDLDSPI